MGADGGDVADVLPDETRVLSLDVFDTCLVRACGPPEAVFLWLGNHLAESRTIPCSPETFARARMRAERSVWRRRGWLDSRTSLHDIYRETARLLLLEPGLIPILVEAESRLEADVLRPTPAAARLVEAATTRGQQIVFASDTYFDTDFVERQLRRHDLWRDGARCFTSSGLAASKATGRLFDVMLDRLGATPDTVTHVGDHLHSDVAVPRSRKLSARWFPDGRLNRYEQLLAAEMWATSGLSAALAGASRLTRLNSPALDAHQRVIRDVAAGVAAPMLVGFVLWVLRRAQSLGLSSLYFLARDGQILAAIAETLTERLALPMKVAYLDVSRRSTNLAATFEASAEELGWVLRDLPGMAPAEFAARLGLGWDDVAPVLGRLGVDRETGTLPAALGPRLEALLVEGPLREQVLERAAERRRTVTRFLRQEGLLDGTRCGLVDFGGVGSQVRALHELVSRAGGIPPRILMIGLDRPEDAGLATPAITSRWLDDTDCYLYDDRRNEGVPRFRGLVTCIQMFCAADHTSVTGYREVGDRVVPSFAENDATTRALKAWGLATLHEAIRRVAAEITLDGDLVDISADLRAAACLVIQELWERPSRDEARVWGEFPFEGAGAAESGYRPLAVPYTWRSVARGLVEGSFPDLGWRNWHEAAVARSATPLRWALATAARLYMRLETSSSGWARRLAGQARRVRRR